jgi:hypothetical protein
MVCFRRQGASPDCPTFSYVIVVPPSPAIHSFADEVWSSEWRASTPFAANGAHVVRKRTLRKALLLFAERVQLWGSDSHPPEGSGRLRFCNTGRWRWRKIFLSSISLSETVSHQVFII